MDKPRIAPYRRHDRPGKWSCSSPGNGGHVYVGTGYSPREAYEAWYRAVTLTPRRR